MSGSELDMTKRKSASPDFEPTETQDSESQSGGHDVNEVHQAFKVFEKLQFN